MLIRFAAKNFYCFREWAEIDLTFSKKTPIEVSQGEAFAKAICLKGANAAGKTNGIKIMSFLSAFVAHSFQSKPDELIPVDPFYDSVEPIEFSVDFSSGDTEYTYELSLNKKEILSEKIYRKLQKKVLVFNRQGTKVKTNVLAKNFDIGLRPNASVVSTANQQLYWAYGIEGLADLSGFALHRSSNSHQRLYHGSARSLTMTGSSST